jgi:FkbH-like protein
MAGVDIDAARRAEACVARAEQQRTIFAVAPRRLDLLRLRALPWPPEGLRSVAVRVIRNHAFEHVASALAPFAAFAGLAPRVTYGGYDDGLTDLTTDAEVVVTWVDFERYSARLDASALLDWFASRIGALRAACSATVLVVDRAHASNDHAAFNAELADRVGGLPDVHVCATAPIAERLGPGLHDDARADVTGTRLGDAACLAFAQRFGLVWLPAAVAPRRKVVAVDLDNTLFRGVLGEDGVTGVVVTDGHAALQRELLRLRSEGLLLAVVSRNEPADVDALFATRRDFPLAREDVAAWAVGWGSKAAGVASVAAALHVGPDAVVLVDDNPGELAAAASAHPGLATLHAHPDGAATASELALFPGLLRWRHAREDALRDADLRAAAERERGAAEAGGTADYVASLGVRLELAMRAPAARHRVHDLSRKTNQFNLALRRFSEKEVAERMDSPGHRVATIALSDRLSDSGLVGFVSARRDGDALRVEELCISCRALGRGLEDTMIASCVRAMSRELATAAVVFEYSLGPRNGPARDWLARMAGRPLANDAGEVRIPLAALPPPLEGVTIHGDGQ